MDTSKFSTHRDGFQVLDLAATMSFKTDSSISFRLFRKAFSKGWIDVHHPCEGHIKAQIHVQIPSEYHEIDKMTAIIALLFDVLKIPTDETYEAEFFSYAASAVIAQATDREGMTDRLY